ncbi:MAG: heparinase II/III family protein [Planctomycetes bacterium]|nr:heparinase II/III family protein [Planctomycetota bacterium]
MPGRTRCLCGTLIAITITTSSPAAAAKEGSAFFPEALVARGRENAAKYPWAAAIRDEIVRAAEPWLRMSDDELWSLMFGHTITRSWMVWSNGHCPACKKGVPMYSWEIAALERPWKVRCPHCKNEFPKNDFRKFYESGLDEHYVFDPKRADRSLLFNVEHPDANDPLRGFGVDDGEGYVDGDKRWRFIGAYLIYGQWKQAVVDGIHKLGEAYLLTGDGRYAHKAGVLLDRVADLYPTFDFKKEGKVYEVDGVAGYVSTWHDSCWETRELVLAWDMVLAGLRDYASLPAFLAGKARQYKLDSPKAAFADIRRNIEQRILIDCQTNQAKIRSNYPQTDVTIAFAMTALAWPENRDAVNAVIAGIVDKTTAVDGTSGEKGMSGYSAMAIHGLANLLAMYDRMAPTFLPEMFKRVPRLHDAFRFHMDAWCLQRYYPTCGDAAAFCVPVDAYVSVGFSRQASLMPSMYRFVWRVYEQTDDVRFLQALYHGNGGKPDGLPHDLFADDPAALQRKVAAIIDRVGTRIDLPSVNKQQWHLGLLRSGRGDNERVLWLDYDSGGAHSHADGMNLGLYARGLDLMPDFGYPPVQYGGWGAPRARWYTSSMAHNTVVVDGRDTHKADGVTTLWADGRQFHAIRASGPALIGGSQYERTAAMVDVSERDFYVVDVFRVVGGSDHAKFTRSHFGTITTRGAPDAPASVYADNPHMRSWRGGPAGPGWSVEWKVEDRYKLLPSPIDLRVRYTDLTSGAEAYVGESWVSISRHSFESNDEAWVPHVVARRWAEQAPLASTFVSIVEPYVSASNIAAIRRLPVRTVDGAPASDGDVAVELTLADGRRDLIVSRDVVGTAASSQPVTAAVVVPDAGLTLTGQLCLVRRDVAGRVVHVCLGRSQRLEAGGLTIQLRNEPEYVEIELAGDTPQVVAGEPASVKQLHQE